MFSQDNENVSDGYKKWAKYNNIQFPIAKQGSGNYFPVTSTIGHLEAPSTECADDYHPVMCFCPQLRISINFTFLTEPFIEESSTGMHPNDSGDESNSKKSFYNKCCTVKMLKRRVPIISWLPQYNIKNLTGDLVAGTTVALTVIPQSMAYAGIANLPPQVCDSVSLNVRYPIMAGDNCC